MFLSFFRVFILRSLLFFLLFLFRLCSCFRFLSRAPPPSPPVPDLRPCREMVSRDPLPRLATDDAAAQGTRRAPREGGILVAQDRQRYEQSGELKL